MFPWGEVAGAYSRQSRAEVMNSEALPPFLGLWTLSRIVKP
jgi:hypothetical protein